MQPYIRKTYDEKLLEQANQFLNRLSAEKIDVYYYSSGDFTLTKLPYKKIELHTVRFVSTKQEIYYNYILEDGIHPGEVKEKFQKYVEKYSKDDPDLNPENFIVLDSEDDYFEPSPLFAVNDICDVNDSVQNSYSVQKVLSDSVETNSSALFDFGDGNDIAVGYQDKKNIFKVRNGIKKYTGGKCTDAFYLSGSMAPCAPGEFNGLGGEDIIIADHDLTGTEYSGYSINLDNNIVRYLSFDDPSPVANLKDIEHACGHKKTQDELDSVVT